MNDTTRRRFVGFLLSSLVLLADADAQDVAADATVAPIQVAVITHAGGAHLGIYFRSLAQLEEVGSVVLADSDGTFEADARSVLGERLTRVYSDRDALLANENPRMALISVEAALGPAAIDAALESGCHVLAEKPGCTNAEDFAALAHKADTKGLHLMLALANRMNPEVQEARRAIAEGKIGAVYGVEMHLIQDQTRLTTESYHRSWFADKARAGGGHLAWLGIHWLDLAMFLTGSRIEAVSGFAGNVGGQPIGVEDSVAMTVRFANGTFGTLTSGYYLDKGNQMHTQIWGSKGWLRLESDPRDSMTLYSTAGDSPETVEFVRPDDFDPYVHFIRAAVRASIGLDPPPITTQESLAAIRSVFGLYESVTAAKQVDLD